MARTLVLNATYEPLGLVPLRRALVLVVLEKAVTLESGETVLRSERLEVAAPAVVRLVSYVRVPHQRHVPLTRRGVFARDGGACVYCGAPATSLDHVVPRSRGGEHSWENVVSACRRCNHVKADRDIATLGWRLRRRPRQPTGVAWRVLGPGPVDPRGLPYLEPSLPESASA